MRININEIQDFKEQNLKKRAIYGYMSLLTSERSKIKTAHNHSKKP